MGSKITFGVFNDTLSVTVLPKGIVNATEDMNSFTIGALATPHLTVYPCF